MKKILLSLVAICFVAGTLQAQISITTSSLTYSQNFNTLPDSTPSGQSAAFNLVGWQLDERGTGNLANDSIKAGIGSTNSGDTYSYGIAIGNSDRALGSLASGTVRSCYGAVFTNNTGVAIDSIMISYKGEQYRSGDSANTYPDTLYFAHSGTATVIDSSMAAWTAEPALNYLSSVTNLQGTVIAGVATSISYKLDVNIPVGGTFAIRWLDNNQIGSDDGLAIDDLVMNFIMTGGNPLTPPVQVSSTPADNSTAVPVSTTAIQLNFDQPVTLGSGNIVVRNLTSGSNQTVVVPSAAVSASGAVVSIISGVTLECGQEYAINYDAACFTANGLNSAGITNNTDLNFATEVCTSVENVTIIPNNLIAYTTSNSVVLTTKQDAGNFTITNAYGAVIAKGKVGTNNTSLSTESWAKGIYFINAVIAGNKYISRVSVQ
jgi:hypothetical protein